MGSNNENYYIGTKDCPHHLSVGAVVINKDGNVLCHHFPSITVSGFTAENIYILVRETLEMGERLEEAVHRGLREEMGVEASIKTYIGSIKSRFPRKGEAMQKTTLYFLCSLNNIDSSKKDKTDLEAASEIMFLPIDLLIGKMKAQAEIYKTFDLDESSILEEVKNYIKCHGQ